MTDDVVKRDTSDPAVAQQPTHQCVRCGAWGFPATNHQPGFPILGREAPCTIHGRRTGPWEWVCHPCSLGKRAAP
jgi:hypothetical protein